MQLATQRNRNKASHQNVESWRLPVETLEPRRLMSGGAARLAAPSELTATQIAPNAAMLQWVDNDPAATGYWILRAIGGGRFKRLARVTSGSATSFEDTSVRVGRTYAYEVEAFHGRRVSPPSNSAPMSVPLATPSNLAASFDGANAIDLSWGDDNVAASGFVVLRSVDGSPFDPVATLNNSRTSAFADNGILTGHVYQYEVKAFNAAETSGAAISAVVTIPLVTPTGLTATLVNSYVQLNWTGTDSSSTGYTILRSTDGTNFSAIGQTTSGLETSFQDNLVTPGTTFYYEVQAFDAITTSGASAPAFVAVPNTVFVTSRYGDELVITATGTADTVEVGEDSSEVIIVANGQTLTEPIPAAGIFVYT